MNIFERMMSIDRRWVFLFLAVVCVVTYYLKFEVPLYASKEVKSIYDKVESLKEGDIILLSIDYDPNALAELHPMTYAILEQSLRKGVKVITLTLSQNGAGMAEQAVKDIVDSVKIAKTYNGVEYPGKELVRGVDYTFLGYKPYPALTILGMGQNFRLQFPTDYYGTPLDSLPIMKRVVNYDQLATVIVITGTNVADFRLSYGQGRYNFPLAYGLTGVTAADYYPQLNSGQLYGLMGGLLGAAIYEKLADNPGPATDGMRIQVFAHMVILAFILLGNIGYFLSRRKQR
jgi:hypothetical protein